MVHIWLCQVHVTLCVCVKTSMMISLSSCPLSPSLSLSLPPQNSLYDNKALLHTSTTLHFEPQWRGINQKVSHS